MKKRNMKLSALLLSAVMVTSLLGGCGGSSEEAATEAAPEATTEGSAEAAPEEGASQEQRTVTLLMDRDTPHDGLNAVIAAIEEKLNIVTVVEDIPGDAEGENIRKTRLATGDMSDITFYNTGAQLGILNPVENFYDFSDASFASTFDAGYAETASVDGKLFGIPANSTQAGAWIYNKAIYEELGLSVPMTWDELIANCEAVKAAGKTAIAAPFTVPGTAQLILLSDFYNVQAVDPEFAANYSINQANFSDSEIAFRGFEKLYEVGEKGFYSEDYLAATVDDAYKMMAEGTAAHYPALSGSIGGIASLYPDSMDDIGMFAQPGDSADSNGLTVWMPNAYYVNKNAENLEAALEWVEFFCSLEGIAIHASAEKPLGPYVVQGAELPDDTYEAIKELQPYFDAGNTAQALEFVSPVKGPNLPQICVECTTNMSDAATCAETYDQDVIKQAKQLGLEGW